jgi:hypothetical protein
MINVSNNSSVGVESNPNVTGLSILLLALLPVFIMNIVLILTIATEKTAPATIRLILTSILGASEVVSIGLSILHIHNMINLLLPDLPPSSFVCRLSYFLILTGAAGRLFFMAMYAVTVYALARYAGTKLREAPRQFIFTFIAAVSIWVLSCVPNMAFFSSAVVDVIFINGECFGKGVGTPTIVCSFLYILVYGLCSFAVSIIFPILTMRYIETNRISDNTKPLKRMLGFLIFLLIGNSVSIVSVPLPLLMGAFAPPGEDRQILLGALNYVAGACLQLSLIPLPIVILVFFKPVRKRMKKMVCFTCSRMATHKNVCA